MERFGWRCYETKEGAGQAGGGGAGVKTCALTNLANTRFRSISASAS
jgi:hypothetical protein